MPHIAPEPLSNGVQVDVIEQLKKVHDAYFQAVLMLSPNGNHARGRRLLFAAQSVQSALVLILMHRSGVLPESVRPAVNLIDWELA